MSSSFRFKLLLRIFGLMMTLLRRSRAMALVMVLLAPGITGSAMQWLHACPAQAQAAADHQHHDSAPSQSHSQGCECIGFCHTAGAVAPAESLTILVAVVLPDHPTILPTDLAFVPAGIPSDLLPPATAPPLA
jgi:hypothetical protein